MTYRHCYRQIFNGFYIGCLLCSWLWAGPSMAQTPSPLAQLATAEPDRYSQSPRWQRYSRAGARYGADEPTEVVEVVTEEDPPTGEDDDVVLAQRVDVNSASVQELAAGLPGIGPSKAQRIVEWRELHGPFRTVEQLLEVPGIGPVTLENIRPFVRLGEVLSMPGAKAVLPPGEADVLMALSSIIQRVDRDRRQALLVAPADK